MRHIEGRPKMAIIDCYDCGKQISDKSVHCMQCGAPIEASASPQFKSSSGGEDQNKISKNYIWYLIVIILLGGFWFSKGTPSPELIFNGSQAKSACVNLASQNKGSMVILDNVDVVANDTWLKDGKRVVQLTQTDNGKIRTIMCLYGNGMVSIPSMFEQSRWR